MAGRFAAMMLVSLVVATASAGAGRAEDAPPAFPTAEFQSGAKEAVVTDSGLTARIVYERRPKIDPESDVAVLQVSKGGRVVLDVAGAASGMETPAASASIADIDPYRLGKEVYFSSYSGGAHCCSRVIVAEEGPRGWSAVEFGAFDGDGGYLEDIDKDGIAEIVALDDAFQYAFDCYACSAAPLVIRSLQDGKVVDVSREPRFAKAHRDWLNELEDGSDPETRWSQPGYLAGWVAQSIRAGSGASAYAALLEHWDFAGDAGEATCVSGDDPDKCPAADRRTLKFPDRLKLFLARHGYSL